MTGAGTWLQRLCDGAPKLMIGRFEDGKADEAVVVARGKIAGRRVIVIAFEFARFGGSMGRVVGDRIVAGFLAAAEQRIPVVAVCATGGARMQDGTASLMQMPRTLAALARLRGARQAFVAVFAQPTVGGVLASFAAQADVCVGVTGAEVGFAGRRVSEAVLGQAEVSSAQRQYEHGFIDTLVHEDLVADEVRRVLTCLP